LTAPDTLPPRLPPLDEAGLTEAQRRVAQAIASGKRGGVRGPFHALLRSPELADRVQRLGAYLRYESALDPRLAELAILVTARHWGAQYEWHAHRPIAIGAGLAPEVADAIAAGLRPEALAHDEAAVYDFCRELHEGKGVGDATWERALARLGERGVVDLVGLCGYYALIAMVLNAARVPMPPGVEPPLR
jgi:4-carboxymuconolactone decarboxylase